MSAGLKRHLRRTYGAIITIALVSLVCLGGFIAYVIQFNDIMRKTQAAMDLYAARTREVRTITSRAQVERIIAGTSHPGCVLRIALARTRYVVTWNPLRIELKPRGTTLNYSGTLIDRLDGIPSILGGHALVNSYELAFIPIGPVHAILLRTFLFSVLAAIIVTLIALRVSDKMAREALHPLGALSQALQEAAGGNHPPAAVPQMGREEIGELIAAYNNAIEAERKARLARDAAEARTHQFIADAGHQLRTPITVLSGFIGILQAGRLRSPDDAPKILDKMQQQIKSITVLVERLMLLDSWQSAEQPKVAVTDVGELVSAIVDPIAAAHPERNIQLRSIAGARANVDSEELTYAISNIVVNAVKYAPEGQITIDVCAAERDVHISVGDEGPGIAPEELPHIFERFYRGSRRDVSGSGLGLAIAKIAVERAHGTITVRSEPSRGTCFTITLPRAD